MYGRRFVVVPAGLVPETGSLHCVVVVAIKLSDRADNECLHRRGCVHKIRRVARHQRPAQLTAHAGALQRRRDQRRGLLDPFQARQAVALQEERSQPRNGVRVGARAVVGDRIVQVLQRVGSVKERSEWLDANDRPALVDRRAQELLESKDVGHRRIVADQQRSL